MRKERRDHVKKTDSKLERRSFIKMGLGGLAGLSAVPALIGKNGNEIHSLSAQGRKMIHRHFRQNRV